MTELPEVEIGEYTIRPVPPEHVPWKKEPCIEITREGGEGGTFSMKKLECVIDAFYMNEF